MFKACPELSKEGLARPALSPVEGKAAAAWASGAYEGVRGHGQAATCLRACASSLLRQSGLCGYEGRKRFNA